LTYSGTFDLFEILMAIRDDLSNTRDLSDEEQLKSISSRLAELDDAHQDVLSALSEFGGRLLRLEMTEQRLESFDLKLAELLSEIEDADITEAIMHLEQATQGLELAQLVTNKIMQASLVGVFQ
jgi:flagellin-like hook-associated protein FlgL